VIAIELDDLIDELEEVIAAGIRLPLSGGRTLIDETRVLEIIDQMRTVIPEEIRRARRIIAEQEQLLATAQARVQEVLSERGLLAAVEAERERLLQQAEQEAAEVRAGADAYARQVLEELDERLSKLLSSVRNGLHALEERQSGA
jgi:cell division septum initiation protein DivIVA